MLNINQRLSWTARFFMAMFLLGSVFSASAYADSKSEDKQDEAQIHHALMKQWNKKEAPLTVSPIVVGGSHAIAGWAQGERGGLALLRRAQHGWEVYMCGGEDLTNQKVLEQAGIDTGTAELLASKLKAAEQGMSSDARKQLSIFEGVMPVEANHHHAH